ncbi:cathepsin B-like [Cimex lectularius]|uniref:Peptidase C1A papain C-terminal domain-containing protein n=1 Tax=Cimex lectularius TaxID=79782 RepID=A0A8I6RM61_CIMLE|nr:cathepsin B-like [Cimex lectularius]
MRSIGFLFFGLLLAHTKSSIIELYNAENIIENVNSANRSWTAGHNFPKKVYLSYIKNMLGATFETNGLIYTKERLNISSSKIPEHFDAREKWQNCRSIGHIRDQGNCGSCWAVSAASVLSDRFCIATKGKMNHPLSSADLLSCCSFCGNGCNGGNPLKAWQYLSKKGVRTGGDYHSHVGCRPYEIKPCRHYVEGTRQKCDLLHRAKTPPCRNCTNLNYKKPKALSGDYAKAKSYKVIKDVEEIQKEILTNGPVQAAFKVYDDFPVYKSGVYQKTSEKVLAGHGVKIIGWGKENGLPYWLIANSWNTDWGDKGLFKIARGQNECKIESLVIAGVPDV